jgi:hypothetical protein
MQVVGHEHLAAELNRGDKKGLARDLKETFEVGVVLIDVFLFVASAGDVVAW